MEINFNRIDDLNATLTVTLTPDDYRESVEKELKKHQKQLAIKGFRPGSAPMSLVKKIYGKSILVDEINRLAGNGLSGHLKDNNIDIIAQPLPSENTPTDLDIDNKDTFTLAFDLGLAPQFEFNISDADKLDKFIIQVGEEELSKEIETLRNNYGKMEDAEASELKDIVYAEVSELDENGALLEGGVQDKNISFTPELIQNDALKEKMCGLKPGQEENVDLFELFNGNETVIGSSLDISREALNDLNHNFHLKVTSVKRRKPADIGQELFDQVLGQGVVADEESFREKIRENLETYYRNESDHHIEHMITHLLEENHRFELPDAFLKRWLLQTKEEQYKPETIDERYVGEAKVLKELLIREKAAEKFGIRVELQDIEDASLGYTLSLFRNYGMQNPEFEFVKKFSDDNLKKRDYVEQMNDIALRRKVYNKIKELVSYNEKQVSVDEFYAIIEKHNQTHNAAVSNA